MGILHSIVHTQLLHATLVNEDIMITKTFLQRRQLMELMAETDISAYATLLE